MAEEEVSVAVAAANTGAATEDTCAAADLKRKHDELESEANANGKDSDLVEKENEEEESLDAKRPRLDVDQENPEGLEVSENGLQEEKEKEFAKEEEKPSEGINVETTENVDDEKHSTEEFVKKEEKSSEETNVETTKLQDDKHFTNDQLAADTLQLANENSELENENQKSTETKVQVPSTEDTKQEDNPRSGNPPATEGESMTRQMEVPNNKVGVLIGKGGETIRSLQYNSGCKIQITRDADVEPQSTNRLLELIGSLESINKAEKLIKDVIAEADAGGSPALIARGFTPAQAAAAVEEVLIQVPNDKVGVLIGKGGETIKGLQTKSGARIQLIPHEGDQPKERTVRVSGDKKQIQWARDTIKEVLRQSPRQPSMGGGYSQQPFRPRGPSSQQQWGSRGPVSPQPRGYGHQQRDRYPSQNSQYPPQGGYGNYPPHGGPRGGYGSGWDQRPPPRMQGPPPHQGGGGYDYNYGPGPNPSNMGPPPQGNYNYPPPQGQQGNYPGQGYGENKYENQAPGQHPYGGPQPQGSYPGFAPPEQYHKAPPSNAPPAQNYGHPLPGPNAVPPQQMYPYGANGPAPQAGYNQPQPGAGTVQMYPQQQGPGYAQVGGYSSYPAPQQGYADQTTQNSAGYGGYQGGADPAAYGGQGYGAPQPVPAQQGYDQSAYGAVPAGGGPQPGYVQPGYDAGQMYGAAPR